MPQPDGPGVGVQALWGAALALRRAAAAAAGGAEGCEPDGDEDGPAAGSLLSQGIVQVSLWETPQSATWHTGSFGGRGREFAVARHSAGAAYRPLVDTRHRGGLQGWLGTRLSLSPGASADLPMGSQFILKRSHEASPQNVPVDADLTLWHGASVCDVPWGRTC